MSPDDHVELGPALRSWMQAARAERHYSQEDMGILLGMKPASGRVMVAFWETGQRSPTARQLHIFAQAVWCKGLRAWLEDLCPALGRAPVEPDVVAAMVHSTRENPRSSGPPGPTLP